MLDALAGGGGTAAARDPARDRCSLYQENAGRLGVSTRTVERHVSAVLRKLSLTNRHQLARWAAQHRRVGYYGRRQKPADHCEVMMRFTLRLCDRDSPN